MLFIWQIVWWIRRCNAVRYRYNMVRINIILYILCSQLWGISTRANTLRPRQNSRHFADDIFKCILFNENVSISIKISLNFVPKGTINNIPSLLHIIAWRRQGDKPISEPMKVSLLTHLCVTRPQWVKHEKAAHITPSRVIWWESSAIWEFI